jgi:putative ABC transport system substrate-binding protein
MRRRELISLIGLAAMWPLAARAQQISTTHKIGILAPTTPQVAETWLSAFVKRLGKLGWVNGQNLAIEVRWAEGRTDRLDALAADLVDAKVDVILTWATWPALAAKRATSTIPIVFAVAADPVAAGLVASLARPGGNVTGLSVQNVEIAGKRLELFHEAVPNLKRLAVMANADVFDTVDEMNEIVAFANKIGLETTARGIHSAQEIAPSFEAFKGEANALYVVGDPLTLTSRAEINKLAIAAHLPTSFSNSDFVRAGGLMSYGANFSDLFRRAAEHTDKILRGTKPADIPVEQPTKFDLVINATTAKALGLTIPPTLLATADEVIE